MAKKNTAGGWWVLFAAVGVGLLYYAQTGLGQENNSKLIPDSLEGKIDALVAELNRMFGRRWVDRGVAVLKFYLQNTLPAPLVALVHIVAEVENISKLNPMSGNDKRKLAVRMAMNG
jgi:hypothetical protein